MNTKKLLNLIVLSLFVTAQITSQESGTWQTLKIGAGGWITGLDIHPSGSIMYARSDVGGAYRYNNTAQSWIQLVTATSIPSEDIGWDRYQGVQSIVSDPTDDQRAYMAYDQNIYTSINQGDTWQKTNFPEQELRANDDDSKLGRSSEWPSGLLWKHREWPLQNVRWTKLDKDYCCSKWPNGKRCKVNSL